MKQLIEIQATDILYHIHFLQLWELYRDEENEYYKKSEEDYLELLAHNEFTKIIKEQLFALIKVSTRGGLEPVYGEYFRALPDYFYYFGDEEEATNVFDLNSTQVEYPTLYTSYKSSEENDLVAVFHTNLVWIFNNTGERTFLHTGFNSYDYGSVEVQFLKYNYINIELYDDNNGYHSVICRYSNGAFIENVKIPDAAILNMFSENKIQWGLESLSPHLLSNKDVVLETLKKDNFYNLNGNSLNHVSLELKADKDIALLAIKNNSMNYDWLADDLKMDIDVCTNLIINQPTCFKEIPEKMKLDKEFLSSCIGKNAELQFQFGEYAWPELFEDYEIIKQSLKKNGLAFLQLPVQLQTDKRLLAIAIRSNPELAVQIPKAFEEKSFLLDMINENATILNYLPKWTDDFEIGMQAVKLDGNILEHLSENLRNNKEIVLAAYKSKPFSILNVGEVLMHDKEIEAFYLLQKQQEDDLPF